MVGVKGIGFRVVILVGGGWWVGGEIIGLFLDCSCCMFWDLFDEGGGLGGGGGIGIDGFYWIWDEECDLVDVGVVIVGVEIVCWVFGVMFWEELEFVCCGIWWGICSVKGFGWLLVGWDNSLLSEWDDCCGFGLSGVMVGLGLWCFVSEGRLNCFFWEGFFVLGGGGNDVLVIGDLVVVFCKGGCGVWVIEILVVGFWLKFMFIGLVLWGGEYGGGGSGEFISLLVLYLEYCFKNIYFEVFGW